MALYRDNDGGEVPPHVFGIAAAAYRGLQEDAASQAIIISGESGAGKTEATKKCLQYFAQVAGAGAAGMDQKLLAANPILEAFGNAKTTRNNNSSRFGKWMEVQFDGRGSIIGCKIVNYLLEKSRITSPGAEERSYHIFYNLCVGLPPQQRTALHLTQPGDYAYLAQASTTISGSADRDRDDFSDVMDAFAEVGISAAEQGDLFAVTAAVLHLGSITFSAHDTASGIEGSAADEGTHLTAAAELLGVPSAALAEDLTSRVRTVRAEQTRSPLVPGKAADARDALAKALYGRMFDWLVQRVNEAMATPAAPRGIIGVLDIFGFEIFHSNVFEQLCINYCNEMLQQHFNTHVFKAEERLYQAEGIDYSGVRFIDNQDVLDLIQRKPSGILPMLDDEVRLPRGSDANFRTRVTKAHTGHPRFVALKAGAAGDKVVSEQLGHEAGKCGALPFAVQHYAGAVVYDCTGWLDKNKDEILPNHAALMATSSRPFIANELFQARAGTAGGGAAAAGGGAGKRKATTQGGKFRSQLAALRDTLNANTPHYIRCIKPNALKMPGIWQGGLCLQQLRYSGVFQAVQIRQQGFPFRYPYREFYGKYHAVVDISRAEVAALGDAVVSLGRPFTGRREDHPYRPCPAARQRQAPWRCRPPRKGHSWGEPFYRSMAEAIMQQLAQGEAHADPADAAAFRGLAVQSGTTQLFYKAAAHRILTRRRGAVMHSAALDVQAAWRARWARRRVAGMRSAVG